MNRFIAASILIVIAISLCFAENILINTCFDRTEKFIDEIESLYTSEKNLAEETAEKAYNDWKKLSGSLSLFVNHDRLDDIAEILAKLRTCSLLDEGQFCTDVARIRFITSTIRDTEAINTDGLF